jgi:hypothetical protein
LGGFAIIEGEGNRAFIVDRSGCPPGFPTHFHSPQFWEELGRAIATFGFLEEVLAKAIFAFTGTKPYSEEEIKNAYEKWTTVLEKAMYGQLSGLIDVMLNLCENIRAQQ